MDLRNGANIKLDIELIPEDLHFLIPLVEKWGFEKNEEADLFVTAIKDSQPEEVDLFNELIDKNEELILNWARTLPEANKVISDMTSEDWKHPYWSFLNALKIRELTGFDLSNEEIVSAKKKLADEIRKDKYQIASKLAQEAFRSKEYIKYIKLLDEFSDLVTDSQKKKIDYSKKKIL